MSRKNKKDEVQEEEQTEGQQAEAQNESEAEGSAEVQTDENTVDEFADKTTGAMVDELDTLDADILAKRTRRATVAAAINRRLKRKP